MNLILLNNEVYINDDKKIHKVKKEASLSSFLNSDVETKVCVVDVDITISPAPENSVEQKDNMLTKDFQNYYPGDYVIQDEKIDNNVFQVIGIRTEKVREVYEQIHGNHVSTFIPYALAIRSFLEQKNIDHKQTVVFLDDLGEEVLITVFEGLKFSKTRSMFTSDIQKILPEVKRSQMSFKKKYEQFVQEKNPDKFIVITNNPLWADVLKKKEENFNVIVINNKYPAFDGLKDGIFSIKYKLPEEVLKKRKERELRSRALKYIISGLVLAAGLIFFLVAKVDAMILDEETRKAQARNEILEQELNLIDQKVYHDALKRSKTVDFGTTFYLLSNVLPISYSIDSLSFKQIGQRWVLEAYVFSKEGEIFEEIPRTRFLKEMIIKDFYVKNRPGKYIKATL